MSDGWICPKCGSVYAPFIVECWRCNAPKVETNTSGGTYKMIEWPSDLSDPPEEVGDAEL